MDPVPLNEIVTEQNFNELAYLACNPDVKAAVDAGHIPSGKHHFKNFGNHENRRQIALKDLRDIRATKLEKVKGCLRADMASTIDEEGRHNFLTDAIRAETKIIDTNNISSNAYDGEMRTIIEKYEDGIILDCGAGSRGEYYGNVINLEIAAYPSTDVLAVGEHLPFRDNTFDAIFSIAVLEHVRDPFRCAAEIARVLKPGGTLYCCVPFLQPLHGYPHHYFNASSQGIRRLFEDMLEIESVTVPNPVHPIFGLTWVVKSWAAGLSGETRQSFLDMKIGDLFAEPYRLVHEPFCRNLSEEKRFELACATVLTAQKPIKAS
ncbi:Ubiquinone biosynthesis O-methyltransferase [Ensifer adhaerens]|uniref:class I SAM-dependent methyltransferase n=1 Tax=Ensifer adhaerens TaxID=106592 RepID=UPI0015681A94|nr:class I SAM-dependent methyltransferase [Ensifer adhaerens]NRP21076.1 Ubiquinone biosynthesis O-methyltransferase [Ensifer adhaerens]